MSQSYWVPLYLVYKLIFTTPNRMLPTTKEDELPPFNKIPQL